MDYREEICRYLPADEQERSEQEAVLHLMETFPDNLLTRENVVAHFTGSAIILNPQRDKTLMVFHNLYQSWSWTGGHADGDPDLLAVAEREAREETGIAELTPVSRQILSLDILPVWGHWKKGRFVAGHLHLSAAYGFVAQENQPLKNLPEENSAVAWLPVEQLERYVTEPQMLPIYRKIMNRF